MNVKSQSELDIGGRKTCLSIQVDTLDDTLALSLALYSV